LANDRATARINVPPWPHSIARPKSTDTAMPRSKTLGEAICQREIMPKKMLIDATHAEETRVVVVEGNKVEEFDFESINKRPLAGNIYLAKVTRVEPSLQAAFVDYGGNRHGFLAFSEVHPDYYQIPVEDRQKLLEEEAAYDREMAKNLMMKILILNLSPQRMFRKKFARVESGCVATISRK